MKIDRMGNGTSLAVRFCARKLIYRFFNPLPTPPCCWIPKRSKRMGSVWRRWRCIFNYPRNGGIEGFWQVSRGSRNGVSSGPRGRGVADPRHPKSLRLCRSKQFVSSERRTKKSRPSFAPPKRINHAATLSLLLERNRTEER